MEGPLRLARPARHRHDAGLAGDGREALRSSFLQQFGANKPKLYASTNAMSQAIVSGEIDMGVTNSFGVIQMADTGAPMSGVIPKNTVLFGGNVAVFAKAPHPNAARLFCRLRLLGRRSEHHQRGRRDYSQRIRRRARPRRARWPNSARRTYFSQPDYEKIIADTPRLLAEWDKHVK